MPWEESNRIYTLQFDDIVISKGHVYNVILSLRWPMFRKVRLDEMFPHLRTAAVERAGRLLEL